MSQRGISLERKRLPERKKAYKEQYESQQGTEPEQQTEQQAKIFRNYNTKLSRKLPRNRNSREIHKRNLFRLS